MAHDGAAVVARDLTVAWPPSGSSGAFDALSGVEVSIGHGELVGVVGESGAGKSTFARMIAGRGAGGFRARGPRVVGGELEVLGHRLRRPSGRTIRALGAEVGFLPQHAGRLLDPSLTIAENVSRPIFERAPRFPSRDAGTRAAELIDAVQLPLSVLARYPWELSAGQRQRVAIARSLILQPTIWVADEPTASVDVTTRGPVLDTLFELHSERVFTAVLIGHDAAVMRRMTDRVLVLNRGVLVANGPARDVFRVPEHRYVAALRPDYETHTGTIALPVG